MRPQFSEFSYGFALTQEICDRFPRRLYAPAFPSLLAEGRHGGGYDVFVAEVALFLQFKASDRLTTRASKETSLLGVPYYRVHLHRRNHSNQHALMLELAKAGGRVYYVGPAFANNIELNTHYSRRTVADASIFFRPQDIGPLPDDERHYVVFSSPAGRLLFCSEPRAIRPYSLVQVLEASVGEVDQEDSALRPAPLDSFAERLTTIMLQVHSSVTHKDIERFAPSDQDPVQRAAAMSQVLFDCQLVLGGSPNSSL